ncbi:hypothetical protein [Actinosynnema sp. NPDC023587]|uniref:hypothetical protein n=1 Tax=Actinosynnema sp. NPDC023587 TaxID=3154695 RepID=UPI0033DB678C
MTDRAKFSVNPYLHTALVLLFASTLFIGGTCLLTTVEVTGARGAEVACGSPATGLPGSVTYDPHDRRTAEVAENVAACESALGARRAWAWPATLLGLVGSLLVLFLGRWVRPEPRWWTEEVKAVHR